MTDPVNVIAPTKMPMKVSTRWMSRFGAFEVRRGIERDREADQHRGRADEAVEDGDQLRHRRHLHARRQGRADGATAGQHREQDGIARDPRPQDGGDHGDRHAGDAEQVAAPRGFLLGQPAEAEDEEQPGDQISDGDDCFRHLETPTPNGTHTRGRHSDESEKQWFELPFDGGNTAH